MQRDDVEQKARSRAEPLPEEQAVQTPHEDRHAEAAAILTESEERIASAAMPERPAGPDAEWEHRRSEDNST